ncbi:MAG: M23 family metallopeptidase [Syntrophobacterales bacterium]|jgi:murein DD-endopeptidase MepM/ murein hydrolase activator NlpD
MLPGKMKALLRQSNWVSLFSLCSKPRCAHIVTGIYLLFWFMLGITLCFGMFLYRDYARLKDHEKKLELEKLQLTLSSIAENENSIRSSLGLKGYRSAEDSRELVGILPSSYPPLSFPIFTTISQMSVPTHRHSPSILDEARALQERMQELAKLIREKRDLIKRVPSILPVDTERYWFSSRFGWRRSPFTGAKEFHNGLDISGKKGTPIIAPARGKVIEKGKDLYQGNYLRINHGWGCVTIFAHLLSTVVDVDQEVDRGELIAYMGSTGRSTGPHLHYQIEVNGKPVDPFDYFIGAKENPPLDFALQMGAIALEPQAAKR